MAAQHDPFFIFGGPVRQPAERQVQGKHVYDHVETALDGVFLGGKKN